MFLWFFPEAAEAVLKELDAEAIERLQSEAKRLDSSVSESADPELLMEFEQMLSLTAAHVPTAHETLLRTPRSSRPFPKSQAAPSRTLEHRPKIRSLTSNGCQSPLWLRHCSANSHGRSRFCHRVSPKRTAELLAALPEERRVKVAQELARDPRSPRHPGPAIGPGRDRARTLAAHGKCRLDRSSAAAGERSASGREVTARGDDRSHRAAGAGSGPFSCSTRSTSSKTWAPRPTARFRECWGRSIRTRLATALKDASEALQKRISKNLSNRARQALKEEMEFLTQPGSPKKIEAARQTITQGLGQARPPVRVRVAHRRPSLRERALVPRPRGLPSSPSAHLLTTPLNVPPPTYRISITVPQRPLGVALRTSSEPVPDLPPTADNRPTDPSLPQLAALQSLKNALEECSFQLEEATEIRVHNLRELQDLAVEIGIAVASRIVHEAIDAQHFNVHALVQQRSRPARFTTRDGSGCIPPMSAVLRERLAAEPAIGWAGV